MAALAVSSRPASVVGALALAAAPPAGEVFRSKISFVTGRLKAARGRERLPVLNSQFTGLLPASFNHSCTSLQSHYVKRFTILSAHTPLVQKVSANELDLILTSERTSPLIIDFYATWCGPCVVLAQQLETLALEYGADVRFLKVDTDEEHELAAEMEIRGLPTMVFVSKDVDKLAIRTEGLLPTTTIRDIIEKEL